ncbi:MAG: Hpt domain-containing protein [Burkholderiaceae bacterium]
MAAFVSETQASLRESEAALDAWFRDAEQGRDSLPAAAGRFDEVAGVMSLLAHDHAADAARHLAGTVRQLHEGVQPDEASATRLADTVGMLGFFVEAMVANAGILADFHFDPDTGVLSRLSGDAVASDTALEPAPVADPVASPPVESLEVRLDRLLTSVDSLLRDTVAEAPAADLDRQLDDTLAQVADVAQLADAGDLVANTREARRLLEESGLGAALQMATTLGRSTDGLAVAAVAAPLPEAASQIDAELLEIFLAEAAEVLEAIGQAHRTLGAQSADQASLVSLRRGFHTLKGSSRMVGLDVFGEAGWSIEQLLNFWMADEKPATPEMLTLIDDARRFFHEWVEALNTQGTSEADRDFCALARRADAMRTGRAIEETARPTTAAAAEAAPASAEPSQADEVPGSSFVENAVSIHDEDDPMAALAAHAADAASPGLTLDPTVADFSEAGSQTYSLEMPPVGEDDTGVARFDPLSFEGGESIEMPVPVDEPAPEGLDIDLSGLDVVDEPPVQAAAADDATQDDTDIVTVDGRRISHSLFRVFAAEVDDLQAGLLQDAREWQQHPQRRASEIALRSVHSLKGSAALVGADAARALAEQIERFLAAQSVNGRPASAEDLGHYGMLVQTLMGALKQYARHEPVVPIDEVLVSATELANRWQSGHTEVPGQAVAPAAIIAQGAAADAPTLSDEIDHELLPLFVEEASEYLPQIGDNLQSWLSRPDDVKLQQLVMRQLHTVKGSARMAGAMVLGQRVHEMETRVEAAMKGASVSVELIESLMAEHDLVIEQFERLLGIGEAPSAGADRSAVPEGPAAAPAVTPSAAVPGAQTEVQAEAQAGAVPEAHPEGAARIESTRSTGQALVRVRADLLDKLVNEAGEVSIARSRLDNAVNSVRLSMGELAENVNRLRKHLREIEMHAETRIQSNRDPAPKAPEGADFDPLEFDRFTRFQELARMLAEAVNDVSTVHLNSSRNLEDAVQDLSRQGQTLRQLQHDLLSVRMVQFGTINDRLYRVVRQSAKMLGKRVSLDIRGHTVHTDRGVLERMVAPLEHLLRNAVSHGIESPEERVAAGKAETGEIVIGVQQSGNEIVISMSDDGSGLNMARIRARAIERGLLNADATVSEDALADLIFRPGFSTAQAVDQISGRGVGMDVVRSEVASLGGRIEVMSEAGRGLRYQIHLPITMALAQVMMVSAGALRYAVSASSVEKLLHLNPEELASAYSRRAIEVEGKAIPLFYLSTLVNEPDQKPSAQHLSPVILVRTGSGRIAVHADEVGKSQEVVVKNVGPQVSRVGGVAGATVLGNGEIVLILNLGQLSRGVSDKLQDAAMKAGVAASLADAPITVMVVDDSVTVRKVTQRLLVREGFDVVLAKDGVDALRQLQERRPDAMLVDIEMPRMDGFDLTRSLRKDERFAGLPIIMITSRTADKHRNFALSLGVNEFLGKPYGEAELVSLLRTYTCRTGQPQAH